jgi:predicted site-specific integrase-resolvase
MESAVSPKVLKEAITTGLLPYYRSPTGRRRVLIEDLIKYVRQHWARTGVIG